MSETILEYLDEPFRLTGRATVLGTGIDPKGRGALILDRTIFYPQGGGQPADTGVITAPGYRFEVEAVTFGDGTVYHVGAAEGELQPGADVDLTITESRRSLHARLHTAGHLLLNAVKNAGASLVATKGYHFPDGPYVEFSGDVPEPDRDALVQRLQAEVDRLALADLPVTWRFVSAENLADVCENVPANVPTDKPTRVVTIADVNQPCGGTHVRSLGVLQGMRVEKIRSKKGETRLSYSVP